MLICGMAIVVVVICIVLTIKAKEELKGASRHDG